MYRCIKGRGSRCAPPLQSNMFSISLFWGKVRQKYGLDAPPFTKSRSTIDVCSWKTVDFRISGAFTSNLEIVKYSSELSNVSNIIVHCKTHSKLSDLLELHELLLRHWQLKTRIVNLPIKRSFERDWPTDYAEVMHEWYYAMLCSHYAKLSGLGEEGGGVKCSILNMF